MIILYCIVNYFMWVVHFADSAVHSTYFQAILLLKLTYCDKFSMFNVINTTTWCYDGNEEMAWRKLVLIIIDILTTLPKILIQSHRYSMVV